MEKRLIALPLTYSNPRRREYEPLIEQARKKVIWFSEAIRGDKGPMIAEAMQSAFNAPWSELLGNPMRLSATPTPPVLERFVGIVRDGLRSRVLIDLGGTNMVGWAESFQAIGYIGVDIHANGRFNPECASDVMTDVTDGVREAHPNTGVTIFRADILDFISRIPPGLGISFAINGIDKCITNSEAYLGAVGDELVRATPVGGIILGSGTQVFEFASRDSLALIKKTRSPFLRDGEAWVCRRIG